METKNLINLQELDGKALEVCIKQINKHFNINFLKAENGEAVAELELEERHKNLFNIPYGGVLFNLADCTTGMAFISLGRPGVTVSASVNFMRGSQSTSKLICKAKVKRGGRKLFFVKAEITDDNGTVLSDFDFIFSTLD
ncbi:MAG: PaaI family thioesterase [Synergistaceae bacterium]|nr:PaaI family thioesterase [Synergistaceae bacterium]